MMISRDDIEAFGGSVEPAARSYEQRVQEVREAALNAFYEPGNPQYIKDLLFRVTWNQISMDDLEKIANEVWDLVDAERNS
jgi:hypothetical protein